MQFATIRYVFLYYYQIIKKSKVLSVACFVVYISTKLHRRFPMRKSTISLIGFFLAIMHFKIDRTLQFDRFVQRCHFFRRKLRNWITIIKNNTAFESYDRYNIVQRRLRFSVTQNAPIVRERCVDIVKTFSCWKSSEM